MKYYEGIDYFLAFEDFPHMGVPGAIASNGDGTVTIYINTLYCKERQNETLRHELRHFVRGHFNSDCTLTLAEKEIDADNIDDESYQFAPDFSWVECIESMDIEPEMSAPETNRYVLNRLAQDGVTAINLNLDNGKTYTRADAENMIATMNTCISRLRRAKTQTNITASVSGSCAFKKILPDNCQS